MNMKSNKSAVAGLRLAVLAFAAGAAFTLPAFGAQDTIFTYSYDSQGNLKTSADPLGRVTDYSYDKLNRISQELRPEAITGAGRPKTSYAYNGQSRLTKLTDARSLATQHAIDGVGNASETISPDSGKTTRTFDKSGNILSETDAGGVKRSYTYDALGRRLKMLDAAGATIASYSYDSAANGKGKIAKVTEYGIDLAFSYDSMSRVSGTTWTFAGDTAHAAGSELSKVQYSYGTAGTAVGKVQTITYPSGNTAKYSYDAAGRVVGIAWTPAGGTTQDIVKSVKYHPAGLALGWTWGNGSIYTRSIDLDGRITKYPLGDTSAANAGDPKKAGLVRLVTYDAGSQIKAYTHVNGSGAVKPAFDHSYSYDGLGRLTTFSQNATSQSYAYDAGGNRTKLTVGGTSYSGYVIDPASNRTSKAGLPGGDVSYAHSAAGVRDLVTAPGKVTKFTLNTAGRISSIAVNGNSAASYQYDGLGRRVLKSSQNLQVASTRYAYDLEHRLLSERSDVNGVTFAEYVYLGDTPVAVIRNNRVELNPNGVPNTNVYSGEIDYIFSDQINTPRVITRATDNVILWRWDSADPYGAAAPNNNPVGAGAVSFVNLRFPGQVADLESGLHYNVFRYYDPQLGRFVSPDPIGQDGGLNLYAYVGGNPLSFVDPLGLARCQGQSVKPGDTGTYGELKAQKKAFGETEPLDMDHQPSFAAQVSSRESALGRPLKEAELTQLKNNTPAVASPRAVHQKTSPTYGGRNTPSRISGDAANLDAAGARDRAVFDAAMRNRI